MFVAAAAPILRPSRGVDGLPHERGIKIRCQTGLAPSSRPSRGSRRSSSAANSGQTKLIASGAVRSIKCRDQKSRRRSSMHGKNGLEPGVTEATRHGMRAILPSLSIGQFCPRSGQRNRARGRLRPRRTRTNACFVLLERYPLNQRSGQGHGDEWNSNHSQRWDAPLV